MQSPCARLDVGSLISSHLYLGFTNGHAPLHRAERGKSKLMNIMPNYINLCSEEPKVCMLKRYRDLLFVQGGGELCGWQTSSRLDGYSLSPPRLVRCTVKTHGPGVQIRNSHRYQ